MGKTDKLIEKARSSPKNMRFDEICLLAKRVGFICKSHPGGHKFYQHSFFKDSVMNFQPDKRDKSKAKPYQVRQLLNFIDDHSLEEVEIDV